MNERERERPRPQPPAPGPAGTGNPASGDPLNTVREAGSALFAAADAAIEAVLSGNSQAFNNAARQQGGQ